jgi:diadenosine tetraphosphate (Ap4A) HIT family hydrolase
MTRGDCKACIGTWPRRDHFIADCGLTQAYLHEDQYFSGWTVLVLKRHATELFDLSRADRCSLIEEVSSIAGLLAAEWQAVKMNYELLGNQLPHIHWHLIPRQSQDPSPLEPVWTISHEPIRLTDDRRHLLIQRLQQVWPRPLDRQSERA